jgi:hypothetical protein
MEKNVKGDETHHCDDRCHQEAQEPEAGPMLEGVTVEREHLVHKTSCKIRGGLYTRSLHSEC